MPSLPNHSRSALSGNDLDGMKDDVLWAEQPDKSDTDSEEDNMYNDVMTHEQIQQMFSEESDDDEF